MDEYLPPESLQLTEGAELFLPTIFEMVKNSMYTQDIFKADSWQPANEKNLSLVLSILSKLVHKNSKIVHIEHLKKVKDLVGAGKSCIFMPEHYSNFDLPAFHLLIQTHYLDLIDFVRDIVSLSAAKLNAESKVVLAFSEAFNRIMIYPAREKQASNESLNAEQIEEQKKLQIINQRAIKLLYKTRDEGRPILMFPSGTRYRPGKPESRQALEQAASFLKRFDYVCFIGIAGNTLIVNPNNNMAEDISRTDSMVYWVDEPIKSSDFISQIERASTDKKAVSNQITQHLLSLHEKAETLRQELIKETPIKYLGPISSPHSIQSFIIKHNIDPEFVKNLLKV